MDQMLRKIEEIVSKDPSFKFEAYSFMMAGLHFTVSRLPKSRHVSGKELCEGQRDYALDQFGPLARTVLEYWGIHKTQDFGKIVFNLIDAELLRKTEDDTPGTPRASNPNAADAKIKAPPNTKRMMRNIKGLSI